MNKKAADIEVPAREWEEEQAVLMQLAMDERLGKVISGMNRLVKSKKDTPDGIEIAGVNGRFVYFSVKDSKIAWEAFENDGARLMSGSEPITSQWDGKVRRMLVQVFGKQWASTLNNRLAKIAHKVAVE